MKKASMISIGAYAPNTILNNFDLEKMVETSDEWITKRTGIKERRIAKNMSTSDLGYEAAKIAVNRSGLDIKDIDMLICATFTPDYLCMPSTACVIASKLGLINIPAFDISAACSGFIYLLNIAKSFIQSNCAKNILIIGAEKISSFIDWSDRTTCILFGDGAGAAVISARDENEIIDVHLGSDGSKRELLMIPGCGSLNPANPNTIQNRLNFIHMKGNEVFKVAVNTLTNDVINILEKNNLTSDDIDFFIPHQANLRIIQAVKDKLNINDEKSIITVHKYGNTSAASIPMAINDAYEEGKIQNGNLLLLDAFGGGFTWGSALLKFGGINFNQL
ncbi:3-oxoacyl-ACP synthase [Campylobacter sputorum subsp. bubulus]|uniref:Beta-ketoacyl-[acyl-carrier-protein] synthase III n=1 Tax=Campylobacter sputorum subsp. sputorum TaxID=32024 RepID=A0A381DIV9_9BACT|nr:beta-ketoacyl-ACP synthase III [Campylobacter sputorum]ASM35673.1 beta-ketoacyl-[acp] synthase III (KASIII) [Campylobacter sputorum aubsp. sputorum RM3237]ASM39055.1 beta-ketoacyl-[acp] synthase III (KASIII) [Campylobacter sputorum bv. paraureolyticus LMG 11764]KAB0582597.1 ketoacyl-ACP synthase III [Campylobacter sputorum subsp. sputorum]MDY6120360.1 beta-ketoacyl-ACP synthase III [Campylobacter sputorum]QEL05865.1 beta-ketoacyl-[acp] synthase III (KASIII) [Campylobacter sputorum subsp. sp